MSGSSVKAMQRAKADVALSEAEKLIREPTTRWGRMMWKPDAMGAAKKFEEAGNLFGASGAVDLAALALRKAGEQYGEVDLHYQAAQCLAKAASKSSESGLYTKCAEEWRLAGEERCAVEALARGAQLLEDPDLHWAALEQAAEVRGAEEAAHRAFLFFADTDKALECGELLFDALAGLDDDHPTKLRAAAGFVILYLSKKHDLPAADRAFLDALANPRFAPSEQARVAEDILMALKRSDADALRAALQPGNLAHLDFQIAQLAKGIQLTDFESAAAAGGGDGGGDSSTVVLPPANGHDDEVHVPPPGDDDELPDLT